MGPQLDPLLKIDWEVLKKQEKSVEQEEQFQVQLECRAQWEVSCPKV